MQLLETDYGWCVRIDDCRVQRIEVDFRLGLLLSDKSGVGSVHIETPCRVNTAGSTALLTPGDASSICPILSFFDAKVAAIKICKTGQLAVEFGDRGSLVVEPNEQYEAWQFGFPGAFLMVCPPGGDVCVFHEPGTESKDVGT